MIDQILIPISLAGIAGWTIGGLTFALVGDLQIKDIANRAMFWERKALRSQTAAKSVARSLVAADAELDRRRAACAKGGRNSHKAKDAVKAATTARIAQAVASGTVTPLRPRSEIEAQAKLDLALRRLRAGVSNVRDIAA